MLRLSLGIQSTASLHQPKSPPVLVGLQLLRPTLPAPRSQATATDCGLLAPPPPEADSTACLIDLTCPLTTFTAATLVSFSGRFLHITSPSQLHRLEPMQEWTAHCRTETFIFSLGNQVLLREANAQKQTWSLHRTSPGPDFLHAVPLQLH